MLSEQEIQEIYKKLKAEQDRLEPVMPIRYMAGILGSGNSHVQEALKELVKRKLVEKVKIGGTQRYRIL